MSTQTHQTRQVIASLLHSGLKRKEFRVRTECKNGVYGETLIVLFCSTERAIELTKSILTNGLNVQHYIDSSTHKVFHVSVTPNYRPFATLKEHFLPPAGATR